MTTLHATIGDGPTRRRITLTGAAGPVDLTNVTSVAWTAIGETSGRTITGTATVVSPATSGTVQITLTAAHLSTAQGAVPEIMRLHTVATWPDAVETFPTPGHDIVQVDPR